MGRVDRAAGGEQRECAWSALALPGSGARSLRKREVEPRIPLAGLRRCSWVQCSRDGVPSVWTCSEFTIGSLAGLGPAVQDDVGPGASLLEPGSAALRLGVFWFTSSGLVWPQ